MASASGGKGGSVRQTGGGGPSVNFPCAHKWKIYCGYHLLSMHSLLRGVGMRRIKPPPSKKSTQKGNAIFSFLLVCRFTRLAAWTRGWDSWPEELIQRYPMRQPLKLAHRSNRSPRLDSQLRDQSSALSWFRRTQLSGKGACIPNHPTQPMPTRGRGQPDG